MQTTLPVGSRVVTVDYHLAAQMVVFSHGFGVRRDARGMFTDIVAALPKDWGYVLFDYDEVDELSGQQRLAGFSDRMRHLQAVSDWTHSQPGVEQVHLVGHSLGALTIAGLAPAQAASVVLLAPPLSLATRFIDSFTKRPDVKHDGNIWSIPRRDGTTSIVDDATLTEMGSIDAEGELTKLAIFQPYTIILAGVDEVLPEADYTELITMPSVSMAAIDSANHDFTGEARPELIAQVITCLVGVSQTEAVD